jgi:hypothetical protein
MHEQKSAEIIRDPITEDELRAKEHITPDDVLRLNKITTGRVSR